MKLLLLLLRQVLSYSNDTLVLRTAVYHITAARRDKVKMTFVEDDGTEIHVEAELGSTLLEVAHENDVELEGMMRTRSRGNDLVLDA